MDYYIENSKQIIITVSIHVLYTVNCIGKKIKQIYISFFQMIELDSYNH